MRTSLTNHIESSRQVRLFLTMVILGLTMLLFGAQAQASLVHRFLYEIAEPETGRSFNTPCGVTTDDYGDIYVAGRDDNVIDVFDPSGKHLTTIKEGLGGKAVRNPCALAVDSQGFLYAKEEIGGGFSVGKVVLYKPDAFPPVAGTKYAAQRKVLEGEVGRNVLSIAVNPGNDHLFVNEQSRIVELASADSGSAPINESIGEGILSFSYGVDVDASSGEIYATKNGGSGAVIVFDSAGVLVREIPAPAESGLLQNIALDQESGDLLLFAPAKGILHEYDPAGSEIPSAAIGPAFGSGNSLEGAGTVDFAVDHGPLSPNRGNLYVVSGEGKPYTLYAYGPLEEPRPLVLTLQASEARLENGQIAATLNGTVNPNGLEISDCHFDYVPEEAFEAEGIASFEGVAAEEASCAESPAQIGAGDAAVPVHAELSHLEGDAYRYRLVAENENPPASKGAAMSLGVPEISPGTSSTGFTEATVRAKLNPEGLETTYVVEYGPTETYGSITPATVIAADAGRMDVAVVLRGLQPATTYHYRFVATNDLATVSEADHTFTTRPETQTGGCPNEALRAGFSANLPDCRAYELVSPPQMNGTAPTWVPNDNGSFALSLATPDGERAVFTTEGTLPGDEGAGVFDAHLAQRSSTGWSESVVSPTAQQSSAVTPGGFSADLLYSLMVSRGSSGSLDPGTGSTAQYLQLPAPLASSACGPEPGSHFELVGCGSLGSDQAAIGRFVSSGAEHVIFTSKAQLEPEAPGGGTEAVYDRSPGKPAQVVSLLPGDVPPSGDAEYLGASRDGTAVAFRTEDENRLTLYVRVGDALTEEITTGEAVFAGFSTDGSSLAYVKAGALHRFNLETETDSTIATGGSAAFVNVSADGSTAYFTSTLALTGGEQNKAGEVAQAGRDNLYRWSSLGEATSLVAVLDHRDVTEFGGDHNYNLRRWTESQQPGVGGAGSGPGTDPSRTNPDGSVLVFQSYAPLTGYDAEGHFEVFRYDAASTAIECLSCPPDQAPATADALLQDEEEGAPIQSGNVLVQNVSEDGRTVFFQTAQPLVPTDVNGTQDVYRWRDGTASLISTGQSPQKSYLWAADADGSDVFFVTRQALVAADEEEGSASIYDARIDGGFASPASAAECVGEACQGPPGASPDLQLRPPTAGLLTAPESKRRPRCGQGRLRVNKRGRSHCAKARHKRHRHHHRHRRKHR